MWIWLVFLTLPLFGDWNETFDRDTEALVALCAPLQQGHYTKERAFFLKIRKELIGDRTLRKIVGHASPEEKKIILREDLGVILKKRRNNHIHDLFAWELSYLLGSGAYVLPSFPVELAGKRVIVQKIEKFTHGNYDGQYPKKILKKVSLETYWKAHLQAYLLGLSDLAAGNIGVNKQGIIRFFDNEGALSYYDVPFKTAFGFSTGFICHSFDWPQFKKPLDDKTAKMLKNYVASLADFHKDYLTYQAFRPVTEQGMYHRLELVRHFNFAPGTTFEDFLAAIFPRLAAGLPELNRLVSQITGRPSATGSSLFFACRRIAKYSLTSAQKKHMATWIKTYIEGS